ncbi:alpha/beta fold hydrolase [Lacrimispora sp. 210928-DFI.3.58]|uniref:alpha/beta fold hydrolase n=1 Tax=Lacrimispora sp. 210928-DFI.3.58 TaxID=2883214 RepID=UPI001D086F55|nr:alpha/beta fold hydrolase [Lacrimispora sp. 210928-DFI.3.58]MCB7317971.1 alpha/beta hydrolase [Lacrimispora sp. 210928-DFI.3.58]
MNTDFHTTSLYNESVTLTSRHDGLPLDVLIVLPKRPRAILQLSHGMCEHKERYLPFMKYMALRGFACVIHDHRGHGKSVRNMSDLGYFYENGGPGLVKDLHQITRYAKKRFQGLPLFLFGHSMGSLAARVYLKYYERDLDGLIVCGSPSKPPFAGLGLAFVSMLAAVKGGQSRSRLMDKLFTVFDLPFRSEGRSHAWICTDKAVVEAFNASPYCNFTFTLNGYQSLLVLLCQTYGKRGWHPEKPGLPILFVSGSEDPCMGSKKRFYQAAGFLAAEGYNAITSRLYEGMRHEILNEPGRMEVFEDVSGFLEKILKNY